MRVLLVDDHDFLRKGIRKDLEIVFPDSTFFDAESIAEALDMLNKHTIDVVVLDWELPDGNGLDVMPQIRTRYPYVRVLIFSFHDYETHAAKAINAGALCFLNKGIKPSVFIKAIQCVYDGKLFMPEDKLHLVLGCNPEQNVNLPHLKLSKREMEVALLIAKGNTYTEISEKLFISIKTVGSHRCSLMKKMKLKKNTELAHYFLQHKLISNLP